MTRLAIAEGDIELAKERYSGGVEWSDDNPPIVGKYDLVVLCNWLQQAEQPQVLKLLRYYASLAKDGGQLVVIVPSLDWAANEVAFNDNPSVATFIAIYGTPSEPHRCGFTMNWLRIVLAQTPGLVLEYANTETVIIHKSDGKQDMARQNVIVCTKVAVDAGEAIE